MPFMDDDRAVGKRVAAARRIAGLQRAELAERINTPKLGDKNVGRIERGERRLEPHEAPLFADALGVPVSFFYEPLEAADDDDSARLARLEEKLDRGIVEQQDLRDQIAQQNRNLGQQTEILAELKGIAQGIAELVGREAQVLARIEELVGVLKDAEIISEPVAAAGAVDLGRPPAPPEGLGLDIPDQKPIRQRRRAKDAQSRDQRRDAS